jgi:hypothetical protein
VVEAKATRGAQAEEVGESSCEDDLMVARFALHESGHTNRHYLDGETEAAPAGKS